ncbi:peptidase domain-containing ABC transporter [Neolewinella antarctica]|uniref:ABC-type bacteriocin/lantibiotic exporter with double-glycine peptidase domain n=1 Tax=Neolewinella antarctica TaxID=442734 RepID=A0ABX0X8E6_9BACT|nr:ABC transporter ATP-binding protein [Neolewinella antarctica]NJC25432.1 ABC-type bacteriocin/lantibiotic exporter with double-glycine peptidase domain [Neolewinella antarctica]
MTRTPPVKRFWSLLSQYRSELRTIYIFAILNGVVNLTLPLGIQAIINFIQAGEATTSWLFLVSVVLGGIAITGVLQVLQLRILENVQQNLFARSAFEFAYRLPKISYVQLDKVHAPELANRFFDTLTIQKGLPKIVIDFSLAAFQIVFGMLVLAIYSPYFIILAISLVLILYVIFAVTGPKGLETSIKESKYKYRLVHWLEEIARNTRTFKLNSGSDLHLRETDTIVKGYLKNRESHFQVILNQYRLFIGFKVFIAAGLLFLGGYLVFAQEMNIGQFVASEIIIILIIASVEKIMRIIDTIYDVLTALDKIGYVTDLELDTDAGKAAVEASGPISLRAAEIEFAFPGDRRNVIDNLSFEIAAGEKVVLEGKSGSGKTVLLQILAGIYQIQDGEFYVNGTPLTTYNREMLYQEIGVAYPTNQIFESTLRENITLGREITSARLTEVLSLLQLNDYLEHQPEGLDSYVDSGGRRLPRAVIQKIMIARIIITEPKLLLLEDPLIFVGETESNRIIDYLMSPERPWTVLVVSHDPYWKERSSRIFNLDSY